MAPISSAVPNIPDRWLVNWDETTKATNATPIEVPIAGWICIAIGIYSIIIMLILIIRQCVLSKGLCGECRFNCCEGSCSQWCLDACRTCDCRSPTLTGCLDSICPQRRNLNFADIVMCQCCLGQCACCDDGCDCGDCNCNCNCDCENINCLCFECKVSQPTH